MFYSALLKLCADIVFVLYRIFWLLAKLVGYVTILLSAINYLFSVPYMNVM